MDRIRWFGDHDGDGGDGDDGGGDSDDGDVEE